MRRVGGQPAKQPDRTVKRDNAFSEQEYCSHLFSCPVDGCVRSFQRVSGLERHLSFEACSHAVERKTLLDISKEECAKRLEEGIGAIPTLPCGVPQSSSVDILPKVKGWALNPGEGEDLARNRKPIWPPNSILEIPQIVSNAKTYFLIIIIIIIVIIIKIISIIPSSAYTS